VGSPVARGSETAGARVAGGAAGPTWTTRIYARVQPEGAPRSRVEDRSASGARLSDARRTLPPSTAQEDRDDQSGTLLKNSPAARTRSTGALKRRVSDAQKRSLRGGACSLAPHASVGSPVPTPSYSRALPPALTFSSVVRNVFHCAVGKAKNVNSSAPPSCKLRTTPGTAFGQERRLADRREPQGRADGVDDASAR
jgi:hypothetical protein